MTELITSGLNPDVKPIDFAHKDVREAWLESVIRQALVDIDYIESCKDVTAANRRRARLRFELVEAIRRIDEGDAKRKEYWEEKRQAALARSRQPLVERQARSERFLPIVRPGHDDPLPMFLVQR